MFHNIQSLDFLSLVNTEHTKYHERPEDEDGSDRVPADNGGASQGVPHQHLEGGLASSEEDSALDEERRGKETPGTGACVDCNRVQRIVDLGKLLSICVKVTLKASIILEKKT